MDASRVKCLAQNLKENFQMKYLIVSEAGASV